MPIIFTENFTGATKHFQGIQEITVPEEWNAFWYTNDGEDGKKRARPEMRVIADVPPYQDPPRIPAGESNAMQWFTFYAPHACGIQRQIYNIEPETNITARAMYHAWSSNEDDPHFSTGEDSWAMYARIGIDPTGGTDPRANTVVWSEEAYHFDTYAPLEVTTKTISPTITIFIVTTAKWGLKHNDAYVAQLEISTYDENPQPPQPEIATLLHDILATVNAIEQMLKEIASS